MGGVEKIYKRVENTASKKLSQEQEEILILITRDFMTPAKIAQNRNTSLNAVYKIVTKLKKKGLILGVEKGGLMKGGSSSALRQGDNTKKLFRLHAQSFTIQILDSKEYYQKFLEKRNKDDLDNNSILLYDDNLVIYYNKDFWGDSVDECLRLSLAYTDHFITKLENRYKLVLRTNIKCDIKEFRGEISKIDDPIAREINLKKEKLRVYDENGVLRLIVDNSYKYNELEAVSSQYAQDMKSLEGKWMDLIKTDLKLSEVEAHLRGLQISDKMFQEKFEYIIQLIGNMSVLQHNLMEILVQKRDK